MTVRALIVAAALTLALAAPASASEVMLVKGGEVIPQNDPALPGESADLPLAPSIGCAARQPDAMSASGASVRAVLLRDLRNGALTQPLYEQYRDEYKRAQTTVRHLQGVRRTNLDGVIRSMERISRAGLFTVSRMPALFFQLKHNVDFWPSVRLPHIPSPTPSPCRYFAQKAGYVTPVRYVFDDSPIIFEYYPGFGLQLQPLANFGKANALANACKGVYGPKVPCHLDQLKQMLDALVATASQRGGYTTWEYWFPFGGGSPPWTSGLSQGTAIQALVAGAQLLGDPHYLDVARSALGIFQISPPNGVRVNAFGGDWYLQYSFARGLFILNGFLQSLNGIFDLAQATNDPAAKAIFARGDRAAQNAIPQYNTGAWTLYSLHGNESDLNYHRVLRDFVKGLCQRTGAQTYCHYSQLFTDYLSQHPKLDFLGATTTRARHASALRFRLSKISCVGVVVKRGGKVAYANRLQFPYGVHGFSWVPRSPGSYSVTFTTIDYLNHRTVTSGQVTVRR
jgi:D-glucuronyl C5-epimerase C-terminus